METYKPLPAFYYAFFGFFEPTLILIGAYLCMITPQKYADDLLPIGAEPVTRIMGATSRGQLVIGGLGSCFLLLAMLAFSMFPLIKNNLGGNPVVQEKMVRGLLVPLALGDLSHIAMCLLGLRPSLLKTPMAWTPTFHGNVALTMGLFAVRLAWFLGIGRKTSSSSIDPSLSSGQGRSLNGQASLPLKSRPDVVQVEVVKMVEEVEASPAKKRGGRTKA